MPRFSSLFLLLTSHDCTVWMDSWSRTSGPWIGAGLYFFLFLRFTCHRSTVSHGGQGRRPLIATASRLVLFPFERHWRTAGVLYSWTVLVTRTELADSALQSLAVHCCLLQRSNGWRLSARDINWYCSSSLYQLGFSSIQSGWRVVCLWDFRDVTLVREDRDFGSCIAIYCVKLKSFADHPDKLLCYDNDAHFV